MDTRNPAVAKHLNIPPALLEEVADNPAVLQPVARVMGVVNLHNMFMQVSTPDATFNQRAEFQKLVNKIGRLEPEADTGGPGNGFSLKIVLNGEKTVSLHAAPQAQPIESTAIELADE